jgi:hypothetical protein
LGAFFVLQAEAQRRMNMENDQNDLASAVEPENVVAPSEPITAPTTADEILKRSAGLPEVAPTPELTAEVDALKSVNLDDIKDPQARAFVERRVKELEAGVNKKFEDIAGKRKELEAKLVDSSQPWTAQRIQELLKDQAFVSSVQELQKNAAPQDFGGSDDEWSGLSSTEKQAVIDAQSKANSAEQKVNQLLQVQEDAELSQRFPGYDGNKVNQLMSDLNSQKIQATRADLWKIVNWENDIQRSYKQGQADARNGITEKVNVGVPLNNLSVNASNEVPEDVKSKGIQAILHWRLDQLKK